MQEGPRAQPLRQRRELGRPCRPECPPSESLRRLPAPHTPGSRGGSSDSGTPPGGASAESQARSTEPFKHQRPQTAPSTRGPQSASRQAPSPKLHSTAWEQAWQGTPGPHLSSSDREVAVRGWCCQRSREPGGWTDGDARPLRCLSGRRKMNSHAQRPHPHPHA